MLIDRYPPEDVFARVPELADQTDPVLIELDRLLDDDQLYQQVRADLARRSRLTPVHGRHSTPAEVLVRLLVVQHLYAWSYAETVERVTDSLVLRWFCRIYFQRVPAKTTRVRAGPRPFGRPRCTRSRIGPRFWPSGPRSPVPASCASTIPLRPDLHPPSDR